MKQARFYECPICHLHYEDEAIAKECIDFCQNNNGCSLEIAKQSIERKNTIKTPKGVKIQK